MALIVPAAPGRNRIRNVRTPSFCENGAKHVADEATTKRVTTEFFKEWSVADLSLQTDQWLNQQGRLTEPMVLRSQAYTL